MIGTRLAHYEITAHLGSGGMGDVYQATDTKLGRSVAVKFLPEAFARDSERLTRFEREARVLASLNHPNIAAIHGMEEADGTKFLVMELVDGETLAERIQRGPVPLDEAIGIARQITESLEAAHASGVVHRDLKPANIKITPDGRVKVLDFGLAKALNVTSSTATLANSPTMLSAMSMPGMILGTASYMSPEQARGKAVDKRTDIFAFGCVLFEMLTGCRAFDGEDVADILSRVIQREPAWDLLPATVPPRIVDVLRLCLEKNLRTRRSDIADVRIDLDLALTAPTHTSPGATAPRARQAWMVAAALGVVSVAALALAGFERFGAPRDEVRVARFTIASPDGWTLADSNSQPEQFAVSPDGSRIVLVGTAAAGGRRLWVRDIDTLAARELPGTDGATGPFWSPDGRWLGFSADGQLKKIAVTGGPVVTLCSVPDFRGGTWNQDGVILFAPAGSGVGLGLQRVPASGGTPSALTSLGEAESGHVRPRFLPDGQHFTFFANGPNAVFLGSLDSTTHKQLIEAPVGPGVVYSQGHLMFLRGTTLMAQPFDLDRLELTGEPVPVAEGIKTANRPEIGLFSASANGVLVYQTGASVIETQLTWFDRRGAVLGTVEARGRIGSVALSPDGSRVAYSRTSAAGKEDVWVHEFSRRTSNRLTAGQQQDWMPVWSPDGTRIVWESDRRGVNFRDLYQKGADGAGSDEAVMESPTESPVSRYPYDWSRDGRFLVFADLVQTRPGRYQLWTLPMAGSERTPRLYLETNFNTRDARFSPDHRYLAYLGDESGRSEVYVQPFPNAADGKWIVSQGGGTQPRWRRDGRELFYLSADSKLMSVGVATDGVFTPSAPKALFDVSTPRDSFSSLYDVAADGQRFLINLVPPDSAPRLPSPVIVVLNWTAGLKP